MPPPPAPARPAADSGPAPAAGGQQPQRPAPAPEHCRGPAPLKAHVGVPPGRGPPARPPATAALGNDRAWLGICCPEGSTSVRGCCSGVQQCESPENGLTSDFTDNFFSSTFPKASFTSGGRARRPWQHIRMPRILCLVVRRRTSLFNIARPCTFHVAVPRPCTDI